MDARPPSGTLAPNTGTFEVTFDAEYAGAGTAISYSWDFDGDGRPDQATTTPSVSYGYRMAGLYLPTVTVTLQSGEVSGKEGSAGSTLAAGTVVNVLSYEAMSGLLGAKWADMKGALARGDIEGAVANFTESSRDSFRQQFTLLTKALPQIVAEMGQATLVNIRSNRAIFDLRTIRNRKIYSFQLKFVRDGDGLWRIRGF